MPSSNSYKKNRKSYKKVKGGSGASDYAIKVYGDMGSQAAISDTNNEIKANLVIGGGVAPFEAPVGLAGAPFKGGAADNVAVPVAVVPAGAAGLSEVGGDLIYKSTLNTSGSLVGGKSKKGKKNKKGGVGLGAAALPALLVYANNAFGRGRKSVRLNPMSHFSSNGTGKTFKRSTFRRSGRKSIRGGKSKKNKSNKK